MQTECDAWGESGPRPSRRRSTRPRLLNVANGVANRPYFFRRIVRNVDVEFSFEFHYEFDNIERIRAEIVEKRS